MPSDEHPAVTRWATTDAPRGDDYDRRWDDLAASGHDPHGEATFVRRFAPKSVLDAGCGTGRVARELARHGIVVVGVDVDETMLATARTKAPELAWINADLAHLELGPTTTTQVGSWPFDLVLLAGNVMIFLTPGTEAQVLHQLAAHLVPGGVLVAGFSLLRDRLQLVDYDAFAAEAGFTLAERWSTWSGERFDPVSSDYAVSVHRLEAQRG